MRLVAEQGQGVPPRHSIRVEVATTRLFQLRAQVVNLRGSSGGNECGRRWKPRWEVGEVKTQLYRHYDNNKKLLYVGISLSAAVRLAQHREAAHWFDEIANVTIETFPTREAALAAERNAIANENPACNIHHKRTLKQIEQEEKLRAAEFAEKAKQQLMSRYVVYNLAYKLDDLRRLLNMSAKQLNDCIKEGYLHTFEVEPRQSKHRKVVMVSGWSLIDFMEFLEGKRSKCVETRSPSIR